MVAIFAICSSITCWDDQGDETQLTTRPWVGVQTKDVSDIALKISQMPKLNDSRPRTVVITQGALPTVVVENGKVCIQSSKKH